MQPQPPPTPPPTTASTPAALPQRPTFEQFQGALNSFNDSTTGVNNRATAYGVSQVLPNFDYQQSLAASNAHLTALNKAARGEGFIKQPKADGGFDFFDPLGNKITVHQYAVSTNQDSSKVLADSKNARDRQFVSDANHTETIINALADNNRGPIDKIGYQLFGDQSKPITDKANTDIINRFYDDLHNNYGNGEKLLQGFMSYYPEIYSDVANSYAKQHGPNQLPNYALPAAPAPQPNIFQKLWNR